MKLKIVIVIVSIFVLVVGLGLKYISNNRGPKIAFNRKIGNSELKSEKPINLIVTENRSGHDFYYEFSFFHNDMAIPLNGEMFVISSGSLVIEHFAIQESSPAENSITLRFDASGVLPSSYFLRGSVVNMEQEWELVRSKE